MNREHDWIWIEGGIVRLGHSPAELWLACLEDKDAKSRDWYEEQSSHSPLHEVPVAPFAMARTPVTNREYKTFVRATRYQPVGEWETYSRVHDEDCPAVGICWYDARAYCKWAGVRLATEPEWVYAATGGHQRVFPWGDVWDESRLVTGQGQPSPVGSRPLGASAFGCLDMAGNVWEWLSSKGTSLPYRADDGREHVDEENRLIKGGGFHGYPSLYHVQRRIQQRVDWWDSHAGFRVATSPK